MGNRRTTKVPQIELVSDVIAREMDGHPDWQVAQWARELLDGEYLETDNGLPYTSHHRKGSVEFDRNIRALAAVLTWKKVPTDILVGLAMAIAPQTRTQAYPYAEFVHSKRNNHDIRRDGFLAQQVFDLKKEGFSDEEASHAIAEKYGSISAERVRKIWQRYKPARELGML